MSLSFNSRALAIFLNAAMAVGPDGNIWFVIWGTITENGTQLPNSYIGRITPTGAISEFNLPNCNPDAPFNDQHQIWGMAAGSDGNVWFDESNDCGSLLVDEITPKGDISQVSILDESGSGFRLSSMAHGPDNTVWVIESPTQQGVLDTKIVCIGCQSHYLIPTAFSMPKPTKGVQGLVTGPDNNMWFTGGDSDNGIVGQITPSGTITTYPLPGDIHPEQPVLGPDKALWFIGYDPVTYAGKQLVRFQVLD